MSVQGRSLSVTLHTLCEEKVVLSVVCCAEEKLRKVSVNCTSIRDFPEDFRCVSGYSAGLVPSQEPRDRGSERSTSLFLVCSNLKSGFVYEDDSRIIFYWL